MAHEIRLLPERSADSNETRGQRGDKRGPRAAPHAERLIGR